MSKFIVTIGFNDMSNIRQRIHDSRIVTRFALFKPWSARLVLALTGLMIIYGVLSPEHKLEGVKPTNGYSDVTLYRRIAERVHNGENYYQVAGSELRQHGYATRPFTNWRLPTMAEFLGLLPVMDWAKPLLGLLGIASLLLWAKTLATDLSKRSITIWAFLFPWCVFCGICDNGFLLHEVWAGMILTLALGSYSQRLWKTSLFFGILALMIRELALPFVIIMTSWIWWMPRPRLATAWIAGLFVFFIYIILHAFIVNHHLSSIDHAHEGWIQFGGWPFVLATARMSGFFLLLPKFIVAIMLPLILLGLTGWRAPVAAPTALTVWTYTLAFLVVGRSCNWYWGFLYAPLLPIGVPFIKPALTDLWQAAFPLSISAEIK